MNNLQTKLRAMLATQEQLNQIINVNWRAQDFNFEDAIIIEAVELFDHLPWKWWKQLSGPIDLEQAKLEAVDIWHFIMSRLLSNNTIDEILTSDFLDDLEDLDDENFQTLSFDMEALKDSVRLFIGDVALDNSGSTVKLAGYFYSYTTMLLMLGMSFNDLYTMYVAKTQLNKLRWANGYGTTYQKIWDGQEDNVWLMAHVKTLDVNAPDFEQKVAKGLADQYAYVTRPKVTQPDEFVEVSEIA